MNVLPIKSIREEDSPLIGTNLVNLSKLIRNDIPVAHGIVVLPPELHLKTILSYHDFSNIEVFEQKFEFLKQEVEKISVPEQLKSLKVPKNLDIQKIWLNLLYGWVGEIRNNIWRNGFDKNSLNLSAQSIFITDKVFASGSCYIDDEEGFQIQLTLGDLTKMQIEELEKITKKANKCLFLPHVYYFILEGSKLKIVRVKQYTKEVFDKEITSHTELPKQILKEEAKTSVKILLNLNQGFSIEHDLDGVVVSSDGDDLFEKEVHRLVEAAVTFESKPVIFKLSGNTLGLIHHSTKLKQEAEAVLFARNKKDLLNVQIAVPFVRSSNEFQTIKRELASLGICRKATLKIWMEVAVVENLMNIEDYINEGIDGVILNINELGSWIGGFDQTKEESIHYKNQLRALFKLLDEPIKKLHKNNIQILASITGEISSELANYLLESGVSGIVVDRSTAPFIKHYLAFLEKRLFKKKLNLAA